MMKYLLYLLLLFTVVNAAAQSNFQTGSVITSKQDTLTGLIDYNVTDFTLHTMQSIVMKRSANDKAPITYTAADLKSFFVLPDHMYLVYKGRVSNNKNQSVDNKQDTTTSFATLFLQRIANGPNATLYVNTDRLKTRYFLQEKNNAPIELLYYNYRTPTEKAHTIPVFTGQLTAVYNRYNRANNDELNELKNTAFTQPALISAVNLINNYSPAEETRPTYSKFFVGASLSRVNSSTHLSDYDNSPGKLSNTTYSPRVSIGMDMGNNPGMQKATFRLELAFSYFKPKYEFTYSPNGINQVANNVFGFDQYNISFTPQFLYNVYNAKGLKFFVGVGASFYYCIYNNVTVNSYRIISFAPYTLAPHTDNSIKYAALQANVPLQAGLVLNRMVELSVIYSPPVTSGTKAPVNYQSIGIGVHYIFRHKAVL
jgi:hypothetical protein